MQSVYADNYETYKEEIKSPKDGETYEVDGAKLRCLNSLLKLDLDKCYVGERGSKTKEKGLFAKKDIVPGEIITFYPGDIASFVPNEDPINPNHVSIETYSARFEKQFGENIKDQEDRERQHSYAIDNKYRIIAP